MVHHSYSSTNSKPRHWMKVSCQSHSPSALTPGKVTRVLAGYNDGWTAKPIWTPWRRKENLMPPIGNRTPVLLPSNISTWLPRQHWTSLSKRNWDSQDTLNTLHVGPTFLSSAFFMSLCLFTLANNVLYLTIYDFRQDDHDTERRSSEIKNKFWTCWTSAN